MNGHCLLIGMHHVRPAHIYGGHPACSRMSAKRPPLLFCTSKQWVIDYVVKPDSELETRYIALYNEFFRLGISRDTNRDLLHVPTLKELCANPAYYNKNSVNKYYDGRCDMYFAVSQIKTGEVLQGQIMAFIVLHSLVPKPKGKVFNVITGTRHNSVVHQVRPPPFVYMAHLCGDQRFRGLGSALMAYVNDLPQYRDSYFLLEMDKGHIDKLTNNYTKGVYNFSYTDTLLYDDPMRIMLENAENIPEVSLAYLYKDFIVQFISSQVLGSTRWLVRAPLSMQKKRALSGADESEHMQGAPRARFADEPLAKFADEPSTTDQKACSLM